MKTVVIKICSTRDAHDQIEYGRTEFTLDSGNLDHIEKVPTREVEGVQRCRITIITMHENYELHNLSEAEADLIMEKLLAFSRAETQAETLTITIYPDGVATEETTPIT